MGAATATHARLTCCTYLSAPLTASWRLCRKCRQTPILLIPLSPHYLYHPQSAPLTASWRLQKVSTNPYFIDTTFPPTIYTTPSQPLSSLVGACKGAVPEPHTPMNARAAPNSRRSRR